MSDDFLIRFLTHVSEETPLSLDDLKLIANALVQMHDYGVSFKKAFGVADKRGRKNKNPTNTLISDSFQLMSQGFFGNPIYLTRFLYKINQGQQPKTKDLLCVANALLKMRDDGESLISAFGIHKKTGHKELDITQVPFSKFVSHENWVIYYAYEKHRKNKKTVTHDDACNLISEEFFVKKCLKGAIRNIRYTSRHIARIVSDLKQYVDIYALPIKEKQNEIWSFYFSSRKHLITKTISEAITSISMENQCCEWDTYLKLAGLYQEAVIQKKYTPITRGTRDYPKRLTNRVEMELKSVYALVMLVHAISPIDGAVIQIIRDAQLLNLNQ